MAIVTNTVITCEDESILEFLLNNFTPLPAAFTIAAKGMQFTATATTGEWISPESSAVLGQFPNALNTAERVAINNFVNTLVLAGEWAKVREFQFYGLLDEVNGRTGWLGNATATITGVGTHNPGIGYTIGTGANNIDTGIDDSVLGTISDIYSGFYLVSNDTPSVFDQSYISQGGSAHTRLQSRETATRYNSQGQAAAYLAPFNVPLVDNTFYAGSLSPNLQAHGYVNEALNRNQTRLAGSLIAGNFTLFTSSTIGGQAACFIYADSDPSAVFNPTFYNALAILISAIAIA